MKGHTYRYFAGEPLYPFGYGLSYTNCEYSNLSFGKNSLNTDDELAVSVTVKNSGSMAADEVVQLYVTHSGMDGAPLRALAAFRRIHLEPGASELVQLTVPHRNLSIVDLEGNRKIVPGEMQVWVGGGQPVTREGLPKTAGVAGLVKIEAEATLSK